MKNLGQETAYSQMDAFFKKRVMNKWFLRKGFDIERLNFLQEELQKIDAEIKECESQRYV